MNADQRKWRYDGVASLTEVTSTPCRFCCWGVVYVCLTGSVAAFGMLFSDRFPICSSSVVFSVRVRVRVCPLFCQPILRDLTRAARWPCLTALPSKALVGANDGRSWGVLPRRRTRPPERKNLQPTEGPTPRQMRRVGLPLLTKWTWMGEQKAGRADQEQKTITKTESQEVKMQRKIMTWRKMNSKAMTKRCVWGPDQTRIRAHESD